MVKIMAQKFLLVFLIFLFLSFGYIIYSQTQELDSYKIGNQSTKQIRSSLKIDYSNPTIQVEKQNKSELNSFIGCYQEPIDINNFSANLKNKYTEIERHFKSSNGTVSFSYEDLYSGLHISYNENQQYFAASTIKAPVVIYIYHLYLNNKIDLNQVITYKPHHYVEGSGSIQKEPYGTQYTIKQLIEKTIKDSDNVAYKMLTTIINTQDVKQFWKNLGADTFWANNKIWSQSNSKDSLIYMKELYKLTENNPNISEELLKLYFESVCRLININNKNIKIAHKSGWNSASIHDMAIVYNSEPYVLSINSSLGYKNYTEFFNKASNLINEFHETYWNEKSDYCYNKVFK